MKWEMIVVEKWITGLWGLVEKCSLVGIVKLKKSQNLLIYTFNLLDMQVS